MDHFIKIENRYIPLHTIVYIDDDAEQVVISVRDVKTGPGELKVYGEEADRLRGWLTERTAVALVSQEDPQDTGYREDD